MSLVDIEISIQPFFGDMVEVTRARKRATVSCALCRRKKIRCNRETPCSNCIRSKTESCTYETQIYSETRPCTQRPTNIQPRHDTTSSTLAANVPSRASVQSDTSFTSIRTDGNSHAAFELEAMRARITELEAKLARANSSAGSPHSVATSTPVSTHSVRTVSCFSSTIDVLQDVRTPGGAAISRAIAHKNRLFGQTHWMNGFLIFREILELIEPHLRTETSGILASLQRAKMLARVIKRQRSPAWPVQPNRDLPAKSTCDQLVAAYLRTIETVYRILHVPSFQRTYESIWENDAEPNMAFVVTLKLVLAIGATVYDENMSLRAEAIHWIYEAHVWLSMPTFKSQLGIQYIQNSILLLLARELVNVGADLVWISAGAVYRAAIYIGLHKDPSELPTMPLLEAEMRRRVWNTLLELSMQTSLLSGGPVLFSQEGFNTAPPRNFDDEQLLDAHAVPKDEGVFTQTSIAIALRKTLPIRLAILKFLNEIAPSGTYEETLRIDTELKTAHKAMRRTLHGYTAHANCSPSQFALQVTDFIMQRYLFCLHTPFYAPALKDPMFAYSRKAAVESSLRAWSLAYPKSTDAIYAMGEPDLARMCRCTMGFFRMHAFQASSLLASEWRMRLEDEEDDTDVMSSLLSVVAEDASTWYLGCVQAGETGIKGYLLLRLLEAWNDAIKRRVETSHVPTLLVEALRQATEICIPILERAAGAQEQWSNSSGVDGLRDMGGFDYQPFTETAADWDMIMLETFNLDGLESFDAFAS